MRALYSTIRATNRGQVLDLFYAVVVPASVLQDERQKRVNHESFVAVPHGQRHNHNIASGQRKTRHHSRAQQGIETATSPTRRRQEGGTKGQLLKQS